MQFIVISIICKLKTSHFNHTQEDIYKSRIHININKQLLYAIILSRMELISQYYYFGPSCMRLLNETKSDTHARCITTLPPLIHLKWNRLI